MVRVVPCSGRPSLAQVKMTAVLANRVMFLKVAFQWGLCSKHSALTATSNECFGRETFCPSITRSTPGPAETSTPKYVVGLKKSRTVPLMLSDPISITETLVKNCG